MKISLDVEDFLALYHGALQGEVSAPGIMGGASPGQAFRAELERAGQALHIAAEQLRNAGKGHEASEARQAGSVALAAAAALEVTQ